MRSSSCTPSGRRMSSGSWRWSGSVCREGSAVTSRASVRQHPQRSRQNRSAKQLLSHLEVSFVELLVHEIPCPHDSRWHSWEECNPDASSNRAALPSRCPWRGSMVTETRGGRSRSSTPRCSASPTMRARFISCSVTPAVQQHCVCCHGSRHSK